MRAVRFVAATAVALVAAAGPAVAHGSAGASATPVVAAPVTAAPATAVPASAVTATTTLGPTDAVAPAGATVAKVVLSAGRVEGADHLYFARVLDRDGNAMTGVKLDISGLTDNPDLRARTTTMYPTKDPAVYGASLTFPADGDYVLTVRVLAPQEYVELFVDKVAGIGTGASHADSPSRKAVQRNNPAFYALYDPYGPLAQAGASLSGATAAIAASGAAAAPAGSHGAGASSSAGAALHEEGLDPAATFLMVLHTIGAAAWLVAVLGLALANRLGPGHARNELVAWVSRHYAVLAGGGLLVLLITGLNNVKDLSPGLTTPSELVKTSSGLAYLGLFAFKMALTAGSLVTTWRIHGLLPSPERLAARPLLSVGAMADDGPSPRLLKLAEANVLFAGLIVVTVAILNQLHHAIH